MSMNLEISLTNEFLDKGASEERASFGMFTICSDNDLLTRGFNSHAGKVMDGPFVSGYFVAEWFAWNWWRQHWEPRSHSTALKWDTVHRMPSIGEGYVWPNITIYSDGVRMTLISNPSLHPDAKPFRYLGSASPAIVPLSVWDNALDSYMDHICGRLRDACIADSDLDQIWTTIRAERDDPNISKRRRLEAMLGEDPSPEPNNTVEGLIADAGELGDDAIGEVASNSAHTSAPERPPLTASDFKTIACGNGYDASPMDGVALEDDYSESGRSFEDKPAWVLGVQTATALRRQENLGNGKIDNRRLAEMAGTSQRILNENTVGKAGLAFSLGSRDMSECRLVMRSTWPTSRRFDLARLIGDSLIRNREPLLPATRTDSYRQKAQRAFAAEFLSPFDTVEQMLGENYGDEESRSSVADEFEVSSRTIETMLMNHGRLPREFFEPTF